MKKYFAPEMDVLELLMKDVITASDFVNNSDLACNDKETTEDNIIIW